MSQENCCESKCKKVLDCLGLNDLSPGFYRWFTKVWKTITWNQSQLGNKWTWSFYGKCKPWLVNHAWICLDTCPQWYKCNDNGKCVPIDLTQ